MQGHHYSRFQPFYQESDWYCHKKACRVDNWSPRIIDRDQNIMSSSAPWLEQRSIPLIYKDTATQLSHRYPTVDAKDWQRWPVHNQGLKPRSFNMGNLLRVPGHEDGQLSSTTYLYKTAMLRCCSHSRSFMKISQQHLKTGKTKQVILLWVCNCNSDSRMSGRLQVQTTDAYYPQSWWVKPLESPLIVWQSHKQGY